MISRLLSWLFPVRPFHWTERREYLRSGPDTKPPVLSAPRIVKIDWLKKKR